MRHAYVLDYAQVCQVLLSEGHPEACAAYCGEIEYEAFQLLMIHEVAVACTYIGVCKRLVYFQRAGGNPFAVLPVASVLSDLTDVDFRIEIGGKSFAVVAGVAVNDVQSFHGLEMVFGGIGCEYPADTRVKAAAEYGGEACIGKALAVSPLPRVFEVGFIAWFVVGRVQVVDAALQAGLHDGEVLIG